MKLVLMVFTSYAVTFVVVSSSFFMPLRKWLITKTPNLQIMGSPHMIECRMCSGFWITLLVCSFYGEWTLALPVYGASYFLATQERK
jgi:hypothetical protein